jgi:hypothetical protein
MDRPAPGFDGQSGRTPTTSPVLRHRYSYKEDTNNPELSKPDF